jgi:hypothetical protein
MCASWDTRMPGRWDKGKASVSGFPSLRSEMKLYRVLNENDCCRIFRGLGRPGIGVSERMNCQCPCECSSCSLCGRCCVAFRHLRIPRRFVQHAENVGNGAAAITQQLLP